jgi:uroporphyrinogen-III synthase
MRRLVLLRPEPGASESATRGATLGIEMVKMPLFEIVRVPWTVPDPAAFDALLLTSANTLRHGGPGLERLRRLPVQAVGATTAEAAQAAGFSVAKVGGAGVDALLAGLPKGMRLLHLGGEDRTAPQAHGAHITAVTVYRAVPLEVAAEAIAGIEGGIIAVHSRRAGERLAELVADRATTAVVALSVEAASGLGTGWQSVAIAPRPSDAALLALAAELCLVSGQ